MAGNNATVDVTTIPLSLVIDENEEQGIEQQKQNEADHEGAMQKKAPDGGWAWVVLISSIICFVVRSGTIQAFPVMFTDIVDYFEAETSEVAWVWSINESVGCFGGFFASALVERYGCRLVGCVGYIMMCLGCVLSVFATKLWMLYVTFGFICGFGASCTNISCIVIIQLYFDKKRSMASAISMSGIGLAGVIYGPFVRWLLDTFTWRGTYLILGGIVLHGVIFALSFRPMPKKYTYAHQNKNGV